MANIKKTMQLFVTDSQESVVWYPVSLPFDPLTSIIKRSGPVYQTEASEEVFQHSNCHKLTLKYHTMINSSSDWIDIRKK